MILKAIVIFAAAIIGIIEANVSLLLKEDTCGQQKIGGDLIVGKDAQFGEFPWMVAIRYKSQSRGEDVGYLCVGSLINSRYVITSASCAISREYEISAVRLGEYDITKESDCTSKNGCTNDPVQDFGIEKVIVYPGYNPRYKVDDIALIKLDKDVTYTDYIKPICLSKDVNVKPGDTVVASGWGRTTSSKRADVLKKVISVVKSKEECIENLKSLMKVNITKDHLCTDMLMDNNAGTCAGDGGGPVMYLHDKRWSQVGIVSFGVGCLDFNYYDVNTNLVNYLQWIEETVAK